MAACNDEELVSDFGWGVEPSGAGFGRVGLKSDLFPWEGFEIKSPDIIQIGHSFSSEDDEVRIKEFSSVVGSFPGGLFVLLGEYFSPLFGVPV